VSVPGDLSLVGFDDVETARSTGLTTVAQPLEESGVRGAELLLAAPDGERVQARRLELELVVRLTTAPAGRSGSRPVAARGSSYS
jgi:DNA-binding LacI/PurR family transcriptional regulator